MLGAIALENYERENAYGESEVRLLSTVAASMGVALENARLFDETQRLLQGKRAARRRARDHQQRAGGARRQLDFQAIIDLVGDKIAEIFTTGDMSIALLDTTRSTTCAMPYCLEHGERFPVEPFPLDAGLYRQRDEHARAARHQHDQARRRMRREADRRHRSPADVAKSYLGVPDPRRATRLSASIALYGPRRENAFGEADVRLLQTLANGMSVALRERAPLRRDAAAAEGNRAARRRARDHQQRAGRPRRQLDFQAIIDLVGDKIARDLQYG